MYICLQLYVTGGGYVITAPTTGTQLVSVTQGMIYVFIHYRANIFGFLSTVGLSQETSPIQSSGNYGLADWTVGIQWVNKYISQFGGDPVSVYELYTTVQQNNIELNCLIYHIAYPLTTVIIYLYLHTLIFKFICIRIKCMVYQQVAGLWVMYKSLLVQLVYLNV
jgi:hypothetical protein